ncbi:redoxin domain-containing protein [Flammeovirga agarivorans]|uniref:Peroxiredoxin family protein n=1 Tax=Flammeovirga agarivorans TaxID=2726742 RepID=A0A7X8SLE7_9BACT|nr:redoxin domain-containing protein [Flammeovirga agarivorans]NLR92400.1 peroxiredoxin family protein [Flammeovirga agarivorans]
MNNPLSNIELRDKDGILYKLSLLKEESFSLILLNSVSSLRDISHLDLLAKHFEELKSNKTSPIVIVSQPESHLGKFLKKNKYSFPILSDPSSRISKILDCHIKKLKTSQRATIIFEEKYKERDRFIFMSTPQKHLDFLLNN